MSALRQIHALARELGIDEDTRRDLYQRVTKKRSAAEMSEGERKKVVGALLKQRDKRPSTSVQPRLKGRYAKKLQAIWIAAYNLGIVRDRTDAALIAFVKRQTGIDHVRFVHNAVDAGKAIEALKGWMTREAGVIWKFAKDEPAYARREGYKIARAQYFLLYPGFDPDAGLSVQLFHNDACAECNTNVVQEMTDKDWIRVMGAWGAKIRANKRTAG